MYKTHILALIPLLAMLSCSNAFEDGSDRPSSARGVELLVMDALRMTGTSVNPTVELELTWDAGAGDEVQLFANNTLIDTVSGRVGRYTFDVDLSPWVGGVAELEARLLSRGGLVAAESVDVALGGQGMALMALREADPDARWFNRDGSSVWHGSIAVAVDPVQGARDFLDRHGEALGLGPTPLSRLNLTAVDEGPLGEMVHFSQREGLIPVEGGRVSVRVNSGAVTFVSARVFEVGVLDAAVVSEDDAVVIARARSPRAPFLGVATEVLHPTEVGPRRAWKVTMDGAPGIVWVDAATGEVLEESAGFEGVVPLSLQVFNGSAQGNPEACGVGFEVCDEDGCSTGLVEANNARDIALLVRDWYLATTGAVNWDGTDTTAWLWINLDQDFPGQFDPVCEQIGFQSGQVCEGVMAHEWLHAVEHGANGLDWGNLSGTATEEHVGNVMGAAFNLSQGMTLDLFENCTSGDSLPFGTAVPMHTCQWVEGLDIHDEAHILDTAARLMMQGGSVGALPAGPDPEVPACSPFVQGTEVQIPAANALGGDKTAKLHFDTLMAAGAQNGQAFAVSLRVQLTEQIALDAGCTGPLCYDTMDACVAHNAYAAIGYFLSDQDCNGAPDSLEISAPSYAFGDPDGDGVDATLDNCPMMANPIQDDFDKDGKGDVCDSDLDNDGTKNAEDNCKYTFNVQQSDMDGDGIGDKCDDDADADGWFDDDNCPNDYNPTQGDADDDDIGDLCDSDRDGDLVHNDIDGCPLIFEDSQVDTDGDGRNDPCDNCDDTPNFDQADCNGDGEGDACSDDDDLDGVLDDDDNCRCDDNPQQADMDSNGVGDECEPVDEGAWSHGFDADPFWWDASRSFRLPVMPCEHLDLVRRSDWETAALDGADGHVRVVGAEPFDARILDGNGVMSRESAERTAAGWELELALDQSADTVFRGLRGEQTNPTLLVEPPTGLQDGERVELWFQQVCD